MIPQRFRTQARCLSLLIMALLAAGRPQPVLAAAPSAVASYQLQARLDPTTKTVHGTGQLHYRNPSNDTLHEVWLHLYLNAFRDKQTLWMRESQGANRGFQVDWNHPGSIDVQRLQLANGSDLLASSTLSETLLRVPLPQSLAPGAELVLDMAWTAQLPRVFARTGFGGAAQDFFMVGQWYPKMSVYNNGRWDTEPWHANAEFFHDIGDYSLDVTVPTGYVVGAAGTTAGPPTVAGDQTTFHYQAQTVTDVAFAASPHFQTVTQQAGPVEVIVYYLPEHASNAAAYLRTAAGSITAFSEWFGPYPHPRLTVIDVPDDSPGAGGMEYPTLVTGGTLGGGAAFAPIVIAHEVGHQWWPMQTLTNEGREPWLDEGLTEYSGVRYNEVSGDQVDLGLVKVPVIVQDKLEYGTAPAYASTLPSWQYNELAYGAAVYGKTSLALLTLERVVGTPRLRAALQQYLADYRWQHPTGADFRRSITASLGSESGWFFNLLDTPGQIDYAVRDATTTASGGSYRSTVTLVRVGDVPAPVELLATFGDGSTRRESWDGSAPSITYSYTTPTPLANAAADPDQKLAIELHRADNSQSIRPQVAAASGVASRWWFWLQTIAQALGTLG